MWLNLAWRSAWSRKQALAMVMVSVSVSVLILLGVQQLRTAGKQAGRQQHIGLHIKVGQQIELLKNHTHVFAAQAVSPNAV